MMKRIALIGGFTALLGCWACLAVVHAQEGQPAKDKDQPGKEGQMPGMEDMQKMMEEAWAKAAQPGPQHQRFQGFVGKWKTEVKHWGMPGAEPTTSEGTSTYSVILGGRYLEEVFRGSFEGKEFEGRGYTGYDNVTQKYVGAWMDNMGTGIMFTEGQYDEATKTLTFAGEAEMPMMGKTKMRFVDKEVGKDKRLMEMYMSGPDGQEMKTMEITYTRM